MLFTPDLAAAKEELTLFLTDQVERTHPSGQAGYAALGDPRHEVLEVERALEVADPTGEPSHRAGRFSVLLSEQRAWRTIFVPELELFAWIPKRASWENAARELITKHLERMTPGARLLARYERREWLEPLEIDVEPPKLSAFSGKNRGLLVLPLPSTEEEEDAEEQKKDKTRKKKPPTPVLRRVGIPLTELAEHNELERAYGRDREVGELLSLLLGKGEKAIALIGPAGVGKTAILGELVRRLRSTDVPERLRERAVWFADSTRLVAVDGWFGDWQRQTLDVIEECEKAELIWSIGSLPPLLDAGKHIGSEHNVSVILRAFLAAKRLTVIGEATTAEWSKLELRDPAFARLFIPYRVEEPESSVARMILRRVADELEGAQKIRVEPSALDAVVDLCRRYVSDASPLGSAVHFLRRVADRARAHAEPVLGRRQIVEHFCRETGLPEIVVRDDLALDPAGVRAFFEERIIGQSQAIGQLVDLISVVKAGLSDPSRPLGSFLFVGPTGVGKTETAKALAAFLFGDPERLIRLDMSEYAGADAVHRFLGDSSTEGKLVAAVRRSPFSVVLLDEIEKASPAIFDLLLQVLGEARLSDESGRRADFKNAVIVMTSNLGVETWKAPLGFEQQATARDLGAHFRREAERFFRPELFNRIDHIVPFAPLPREAIDAITRRELDKLRAREGLRHRGVELTADGGALELLAEEGVDPRYGARPLKRTIERLLTVPLARELSRAKDPPSRVHVSFDRARGWRALALELTPRTVSRQAARSPIEHALALIDRLRHRLVLWLRASDHRELQQEVRLLDQLGASPLFWDDRAIAEARMRGVDEKRVLLEDAARLLTQLDGLADLGLDAHFSLDTSPAPLLEEEIAAAKQKLEELELRLYSRRFERPDRALLYLSPARGSSSWGTHLLETYVRLAVERRWNVWIYMSAPILVQETAEREPPKRKRSKDEPAEPARERPRGRKHDRWKQAATTANADPLEEDDVRGWVGKAIEPAIEETIFVLTFEGAHAAAILAGESGEHIQIGASGSDSVRVLAQPGVTSLTAADALPVELTRCRTLHVQKRQLVDHALGQHLALEPRLHRLYARLMRGRLYLSALGERGKVLFRAWEES